MDLLELHETAVSPEVAQPQDEPTERSWQSLLLADLIKAGLMTALLFLFVITFVVQGFKVYGSCMEPNLETGQRVLGNKFVYKFDRPQRGDVIVFRYPKDPSRIYIKRVVALPGETIEIRNGQVFIDNERLVESYVRLIPHGNHPRTRIGENNLFVLGDFRDASNDSRYWGELPMENIQAKIWLRYWPVEKIEVVR
jgi:signal peptidase I